MNLTKENIADIVSYINLADIKEFVLTHPELVQEEEKKNNSNIICAVVGVIILKTIKIAPYTYMTTENVKGGE